MSARIQGKLDQIDNLVAAIRAELSPGPPFEGEWYKRALNELGVEEYPGEDSNPRVEWYQTFTTYDEENRGSDRVPWCAAFAWAMLDQQGSAAARSLLAYGDALPLTEPIPVGAVVVFWRGKRDNGSTGHVGFCAGYADDGDILVLGGNQSSPEEPQGEVCIKPYPVKRLLGARWPKATSQS